MEKTESGKAAYNAYQRAWRARNKDRVREINRRYWIKRAEKEARKGEANAENKNN